MNVLRRSVDENGWPLGGAMPSGDYVAATDYDEVCQQLRDAAGENERLRSQLAGAVSREHATQAIGWLSAEVAVHGAPSLGPEWLELWDRALAASGGGRR